MIISVIILCNIFNHILIILCKVVTGKSGSKSKSNIYLSVFVL